MTDYAIQKATAEKYGVVPSPNNIYDIYSCRKAILEKLGGDSSNANTIFEVDKRILPLIGEGTMPIVTMTAAEYAAITPDASTIYLIKD